MSYLRMPLMIVALVAVMFGAPALRPLALGAPLQESGNGDAGGKKQSPERAITQVIRGMQMDLEGSSRRGFLANIDAAKFDDYSRFEQMVEQLTRDNSLRVYFRQGSTSIKEGGAQVIIDAEMEMTRKDAAGQVQQHRQQVIVDFESTARGWKIVNITPREFFRAE